MEGTSSNYVPINVLPSEAHTNLSGSKSNLTLRLLLVTSDRTDRTEGTYLLTLTYLLTKLYLLTYLLYELVVCVSGAFFSQLQRRFWRVVVGFRPACSLVGRNCAVARYELPRIGLSSVSHRSTDDSATCAVDSL